MFKIKFYVCYSSFFILLLLSCRCTVAQEKKNNLPNLQSTYKQDSLIRALNKKIIFLERANSDLASSVLDKRMPWIIALSIGLLGVFCNIYISNRIRRTSLEINRRDFNKTVLSANRQLWITEFRGLMSQIITDLTYYSSKESLTNVEYSSFSLLLTKAQLMLTNNSDVLFIDTLIKLHASCYSILKQSPNDDDLETQLNLIKKFTISNIQSEWDKVTKGV